VNTMIDLLSIEAHGVHRFEGLDLLAHLKKEGFTRGVNSRELRKESTAGILICNLLANLPREPEESLQDEQRGFHSGVPCVICTTAASCPLVGCPPRAKPSSMSAP